MTWQNLPCPPTLAAISAACPLGWAEVEFTYQAGNPTADPPQDADCTQAIGRTWGIREHDTDVTEFLNDLVEPPLGVPSRDFVMLARMLHVAEPCNTCGRARGADETQWSCFVPKDDQWPDGSCTGMFPLKCVLQVGWGEGGRPVYFEGAEAVYSS